MDSPNVFTYDNFQLIIEHAPIGIVIIDKNYKWLLTNKRFSEITGYSREELQHLTFLDITHKDDIELNLNLYGQLTSGKVDEYVYEKRYVRKNGQILWVRLTVAGVRIGGEYSYMIALIQDGRQ
jgi:PAS domain S-box-containing protein